MPDSASCTRLVSVAYCFCWRSVRTWTIFATKNTMIARNGIGVSDHHVKVGEMKNITVRAAMMAVSARAMYMYAGPM